MREYLAWYRYPEPNGTHYLENDLKQPEKVIEVFDYCQICLAIITEAGWDFLIKHYGYEKLFLLDKESGWLDCSTVDEFIEWVQYYKSLEDLAMSDKIFGKLFGGIIGLCVADALGVPVEFNDRESLMRNPVTGMRGHGTYNQLAGTWSDDTSMTLCLLDSLASGLDYQDIMKKFLSWFNRAEYTPYGDVFDIGSTTHKAIMNFARGTAALQCGGTSEYDNGNGSLMRILPLAFYLRAQYGDNYTDNSAVFDIIHNVSALTHAHKRSLIACGIYLSMAECLFNANDINEGIYSGVSKAKHYYENNSHFAKELQHYE